MGKAVSAFPFETPHFQGLCNSTIKISSRQKLGMQCFSLRLNFLFFHKLSKGKKKTNPALWLFLLFLRHKNRKQKCTSCALFWNFYKNIYRPLRGMSVLGVLHVFPTDDFIRLTSPVLVRWLFKSILCYIFLFSHMEQICLINGRDSSDVHNSKSLWSISSIIQALKYPSI